MAFSFERPAKLLPHLAQNLPDALQRQAHSFRDLRVTEPLAAVGETEDVARVRREGGKDALGAGDPLAREEARLGIGRGIDQVGGA